MRNSQIITQVGIKLTEPYSDELKDDLFRQLPGYGVHEQALLESGWLDEIIEGRECIVTCTELRRDKKGYYLEYLSEVLPIF